MGRESRLTKLTKWFVYDDPATPDVSIHPRAAINIPI